MVNLVILPVNAVCVVVLEDVAVAALGTAGAQVMVVGVTVPVGDPQDAAVCLLVGAAIAGHQDIVDVRNCHMPMEMVLESDAEAEAEFCKLGDLTIEGNTGHLSVLVWLASLQLCLIRASPSASTLGFGVLHHWFCASTTTTTLSPLWLAIFAALLLGSSIFELIVGPSLSAKAT